MSLTIPVVSSRWMICDTQVTVKALEHLFQKAIDTHNSRSALPLHRLMQTDTLPLNLYGNTNIFLL